MDVRRIDPDDGDVFDQWCAIWRLTDEERWPELSGWGPRDFRAMATHGGAREHRLLAAFGADGTVMGVGKMEVPHRDNLHSASLDVRVDPDHRRRRVGTAIVDEVARQAVGEGRSTLQGLFEVPTEQLDTSPAEPFARSMGFEATLLGNRRILTLPVPVDRLAALREEVADAPGSEDYRVLTFTAPWPDEFMADQCEMYRRMSTDQPSGDEHNDEEVWDAARVRESHALNAAQGLTKLAAVAQHVESGHLVAFSELMLSSDRPSEAGQWSTLVLREHRGHRLGLAVKLANLEFLATVLPTARRVDTGNAQDNAPMIAVNDMLGFEVVGTGTFWQKTMEST
jgi:GNAT superfamily N-acetyltransferase